MALPIGFLPVPAAALPPPVEVSTLPDQPFPALLLGDPAQATVLLAMPGGLGERIPLPAGIDSRLLAARVGERLRGLLPEPERGTLAVLLAASQRRGVQAVGHGGVALLVVPADGSAEVEEMASAAAEALLAGELSLAAPAEPASEPLLALGEALTRCGALALASLPASLRPVNSWLEAATARATLDRFVTDALDEKTPWATRRAALLTAGRPRGAAPALSQAAAWLLECVGQPASLVARPLSLLEAWSRLEGKDCPRAPRVLRRALADPGRAGIAAAATWSEAEAVRASARERRVAAGGVDPLPDGDFSPAQTLLLAARARSEGSAGLCAWLRARAVPSQALTGCRDEEVGDGFFISRALPGRGFEVVWVARDGGQYPVMVWPRWVLAPTLCWQGASVCFVDPRGVWSAPLDGHAPPALLTAGSFRLLAADPERTRLAAARWPEAEVWLGDELGARARIPVAAHRGIAWVDREVLAVTSGAHIGLLAPSGEGMAEALASPATTAMSARGGTLYVAEDAAAGPALVRVDLATGQRQRLTPAPGAVSSLHAARDGSLIVATSAGLWRWRPGEAARRFSDGLSVGP